MYIFIQAVREHICTYSYRLSGGTYVHIHTGCQGAHMYIFIQAVRGHICTYSYRLSGAYRVSQRYIYKYDPGLEILIFFREGKLCSMLSIFS